MRVLSSYRLGDVACNKWLVLFRYARKPTLLPQAYVTLEHESYRKHGRSCREGGSGESAYEGRVQRVET
jgi:hypothetical protein